MATSYCSNCGEETVDHYISPRYSLCCDALIVKVQPVIDLENFTQAMETSGSERRRVLEHVRSMPADSKKRRKQYNPPKDKWPGKLSSRGLDYKKTRRSSKKEPPTIKPNNYVDITSDTANHEIGSEFLISIVHPDFKVPEMVTGNGRAEARRKARAWLRAKGLSITTASRIIEGESTTTIIFEKL